MKNKKGNHRQASAILYPDKILIGTVDEAVAGFTIPSIKNTFMQIDVSFEIVGKTIKKHLSLSEWGVPTPASFDNYFDQHLNWLAFNNARDYYRNARYLTIIQRDDLIDIYTTRNNGPIGRDGGFLNIIGGQLQLTSDTNDDDLGRAITDAWNLCEINFG
jgi:hypothetical protein